MNLTEELIKSATLLCYHYRVISKEHAKNKLKTNDWYKDNGDQLHHLWARTESRLHQIASKKYLQNLKKN